MISSKKPKLDDSARSELSRPRTTRGRGSRTVGKLAPLFDMPADIWFEIVSHLTPKELLALSRTSKHFRTMLMHRSGKHFWAAARLNVGLPEPPQHISEPRVAAMLFSSTCFGCGNRGLLYDVGLIARHCKRCKMEKVKKGCTLRRTYGVSRNGSMPVLQLIPCSRGIFRSYHDMYTMNDESSDSYDVGKFQSVFAEHNALLEGGDQVALQTFIDERKHLVQAARQFSKELKVWESEQHAAKQDAGRIRQESIEKKLLELGYTRTDLNDVVYSASFDIRRSWNTMTCQPQKLTPRAWMKVRPRLEELLAGANAQRKRHEQETRRSARVYELCSVYAEFLRGAPVDVGPLPHLHEALCLPAVSALLDGDEGHVPVTVKRLHLVLPALQEAARDHRSRLAQAVWTDLAERTRLPQEPGASYGDPTDGYSGRLFALDGGRLLPRERMPRKLAHLPCVPADIEPGSEDVLNLATALFRCYHCVDRRRVPMSNTGDAVYNIAELAAHVHAEHPNGGFNPVQPKVDSEVARNVLRQLGLPEDVRYEDILGKIVCACATFRHPATFAQLVSHIIQETSFYHALDACSYFSSCPIDEFPRDQHDFTSATPFLRLLGADESFVLSPLSDAEGALAEKWTETFGGKPVACRVCALCASVPHDSPFWWRNAVSDDVPYVPHAPAMDSVALVRHVKMMHGRQARLEDAQEEQEIALP